MIKVCLPLAVILMKLHFIIATRAVIGANINVCENVDDHIFLQDIENCAKYIVCINGQAKSQQCQPGLYFDVRHQACTPSKQSCLQCPSDRMINKPLLKTCDKYISCYYGQSLLKQCGTNQQFNVETGKCDLIRNVDCVENRCSIYATDKQSMYFASAASCSNYYVCQAGRANIQTCDDGLYFSRECNCCDKSENVQCLIEDFKTPANSTKQKRLSIDFTKLKHKATLVGETNKVKCPPIGQFLYQYIEDPAYFFTCIEGKATLYACPSEFQFDDKLKRCVSKENEEPMNIKLLKDNHNEEENICPQVGAQIMAHVEKDKYILCTNGNATVFKCPNEQYFDATENICRSNVERQHKKQLSKYGKMIDEFAGIECPKYATFTIPHAEKQKFYLCLDGKANVFTCAEGQIFDNTEHDCRDERNNDTNNYSANDESEILANQDSHENDFFLMQTNTGMTSNFICPKLGTFMYPHVQKNRYYICIDGNAIVFACAEGHVFDALTTTCKHEEYQTDINGFLFDSQTPKVLDEAVDILCPPFGAMKFAHKQKHKFYLCVNGMGSVLECAEGSFFERKAGICRRTFELTINENTAENIPTNEDYSLQCSMTGTFIYAHTKENLYSVCLDGKPLVLTCPHGLIFDNNAKTCSAAILVENSGTTPSSDNKEEDIQHTTNAGDLEEKVADVAIDDE